MFASRCANRIGTMMHRHFLRRGGNATFQPRKPSIRKEISVANRFRTIQALALAAALFGQLPATPVLAVEPVAAPADGIVRLKSANSFDETVARIKADIQAKGIRFFDQIDQAGLGKQADLALGHSTLLIFGNPPLGVQFLQSNPYAGLDWPVRMLVVEEKDGSVWVAWTDFAAISQRYGIADKPDQLKMASQVAASIATAGTTG
jgi:uncharacterized protein (DUF302 family)